LLINVISEKYSTTDIANKIDVELVNGCLHRLKYAKASAPDGLSAEHLICALYPLLVIHVCALFRAMIVNVHVCVPGDYSSLFHL